MLLSQIQDHASVGNRLRSARESRGLQLVDIAGTLRIKPQFLEALESDRPEALPTPTHASGFLRSYARYLGVELTDVAALIPAPPVITPLMPPLAQPNRLATILLPLLIVGGLIVLYALWHWLQTPTPASIEPPPADFGAPKLEPLEPKLESKVEAAPATDPVPVETPMAPAEPAKPTAKTEAAKPDTLVVRAVSDAWVQITDANGRQLYSKLMRAGESWRAPQQQAGSQGLRLSTGNAGGLVLVKNGEAGVSLGAQAQVLRNLALTASVAKPAPVVKPVTVQPASNVPDSTPADDTPDIEE